MWGGREGKKWIKGRKNNVFLGARMNLEWSYIDGRSLQPEFSKGGREVVARISTVPPSLSEAHHLLSKAAITTESGRLLGKDVGNKIQESLRILLWMDSRDLCPCPMFDSFGCMSCFFLGIILCQDVNEAHEIYLLLGGAWGETNNEKL